MAFTGKKSMKTSVQKECCEERLLRSLQFDNLQAKNYSPGRVRIHQKSPKKIVHLIDPHHTIVRCGSSQIAYYQSKI